MTMSELRAALMTAALTVVLLPACSDSNNGTSDGGKDAGPLEASAPDARGKCGYPDAAAPGSCATKDTKLFKGQYQTVISSLQMGGYTDGFDLNNEDCDNDLTTGVDNILWVIGAIANSSLDESMTKGEIAIPFEFYDVDSAKDDACINYALYVGYFPPDYDEDGQKAGGPLSKPGKDCNDTDKDIKPGANEIVGNGVDDDCDGLADESGTTPGTDTGDADGDKQTIKDGDCDDRKDKGASIKKGGTELCGDGLDNDCDGTADEGCLPWTKDMQLPVEELGLTAAKDESLITVKGAKIKNGKLIAGPSRFGVKVEVTTGKALDLNLTHVFVQADVTTDSAGMQLKNGLLSGVLSARAMGQAPNLLSDYYGNKDDTLLDVLLGPIGTTLGLPKDKDGNHVPDVDVDGDGVEKFLDKNLDGDKTTFKVDTCVDGDGTTIKNKYDSTGKTVTERCTDAKTTDGKHRFVDGWSIALKFNTSPTRLKGTRKSTSPK